MAASALATLAGTTQSATATATLQAAHEPALALGSTRRAHAAVGSRQHHDGPDRRHRQRQQFQHAHDNHPASRDHVRFHDGEQYQQRANALPVITGHVTLAGNNDVLERTGPTPFRLFDVANGGSLTLENLTLQGGLAQGKGAAAQGGAVFSSGTLNLSSVTVQSNQAVGSNGAAGNQSASGGNGANAFGGGLFVASGSVTLADDTLANNSARGGLGGGGNGGSITTVSGNGGNGGNGAGGGLYVAKGSVVLSDDTLYGNMTLGGGGGNGGNADRVHAPGGSGGSGGDGSGGAVAVTSGSITLSSVTLDSNNAQGGGGGQGGNGGSGSGGGLYLDTDSTTVLANTLIAQDAATAGTAGQGGSGNFNGSAGSAGNNSASDVWGKVTSSDHDLIGNPSGSTGFGTSVSGDLLNVTPKLGLLQNNGGPTQTLALLPGSPAIDASDSNAPNLPSTDQRGFARKIGNAVDIGAVEYQYDLALTGSAPATVAANNLITYTLTLTNKGPDLVAAPTLTDVLPSTVTFQSLTAPTGWTLSTPTVGQTGTVTATDTTNLATGASATFTLVVQANVTTQGSVIRNTASAGPTTWDKNSGNNTVTLSSTVPTSPPAGVDIHGQPSNGVVGQPIGGPITVAVVDANGNTIVTNNTQLVTLSLFSGPAGAQLSGTTTVQAVHGVATFTDVTVNLPGTYTLMATGGSLTPDFSNPFTISAVNPPPVSSSSAPSPPPAPATPALNVPLLLKLFDELLHGTETVNADGTVTVMDSVLGLPLLVSTYSSSGQLERVLFLGMNLTLLFL